MDFIQMIIQGGSVGVAVMALWVIWKLVGNHINHNTDAMMELAKAITELTTYIKNFHKKDE